MSAHPKPRFRTVGELVFLGRQAMGLTQRQLGEAASLSAAYISSIENERCLPPPKEVCCRLSEALQMTSAASQELMEASEAARSLRGVRLPRGTPDHIRQAVLTLLRRALPGTEATR